MSEKVTAMIEEIKGLTVLELSELVHALEEEFGVSAAAMAAPAAGGAAAPAAEEKTDFDVILTGFDAAQKIKVIKVIREVMGLGLAEAKAAVEGAPTTMKEGLSKEDAEALKKQVEEVGGKVELK
jgi:large subunit ribosomal protein L7/L12